MLVGRVVEEFGGLDMLVHMASVYRRAPLDELGAEQWDTNMAVDARAGYLTALAAAPHMKRAGEGRMVFFTDWVVASRRPRYRNRRWC